MKWMLVLLYTGLGNAEQVATAIGPYDNGDQCIAIRQLVSKDGWKGFCYPVGNIPLQKRESEKKPEKKKP